MALRDIVDVSITSPIRAHITGGAALPANARHLRLTGQTVNGLGGEVLNFTWLHYVQGYTTYCGLHAGTPVLTGYMSGCYLFRYRINGSLKVAHVGTDSTSVANNTAAKNSWRALTTTAGVADIHGFDPANEISTDLLSRLDGRAVAGVLGGWDEYGVARIGLAAQDHGAFDRVTIVGWEAASMRPWATIQGEPKFQ